MTKPVRKETDYLPDMTCPECGRKRLNPLENENTLDLIDCDCGATYRYERHIIILYSTDTIRTKEENEALETERVAYQEMASHVKDETLEKEPFAEGSLSAV